MTKTEITLEELEDKTIFSKRQINDWRNHGILPETLNRKRTGRVNGEIVYYPIIGLDLLKHFPYLL